MKSMLIFFVLFFLLIGTGSFAQPVPDPCIRGIADTDGNSWDVFVDGDFAYIADYLSGMKIINISNPSTPILVGSLDTDGNSLGIAISGSYAYLADGTSGLNIIDISDPSNPVSIGSQVIDGGAYGVVVSGNYAYVGAGLLGMKIVDISTPANPVTVGSAGGDTSITAVSYYGQAFISGNYAYIAHGEGGAEIIDISNPSDPIIVGTIHTFSASGIYVSGNYAYVSNYIYDSGLEIFDISNTSNPINIGAVSTDGNAHDVFVYDNYAYVANGSTGLKVINISDPSNPDIVDSIDTDGSSQAIYVLGDYLYLADGNEGLKTLQKNCLIGDFTASTNFGYTPLTVQFTDQTVGSPTSWLWNFGDGNISTEQNPEHTYNTSGIYSISLEIADDNQSDLIIMTDYITVFDSLQAEFSADTIIGPAFLTVQFTDFSSGNPTSWMWDFGDGNTSTEQNPNHIYTSAGTYSVNLIVNDGVMFDTLTKNGYITVTSDYLCLAGSLNLWGILEVSVSGDYAYISDLYTRGIKIVYISDPTNLITVGMTDAGGIDSDSIPFGFFVSGDQLYATDGADGVKVYDISDPTDPFLTGAVDIAAIDIFVSGNYAYVTSLSSGIVIVNVSDPTNPYFVGSLGISGSNIFISGNYAYVTGVSSEIVIVNISDPINPLIVGSMGTSGSVVFVYENYAYITGGAAGVMIVDVSDPTNPSIVGPMGTSGSDVFVSGNYAYVADDRAGIKIIDITDPTSVVLVDSVDTDGSAKEIFVSGNYIYLTDWYSGFKIIKKECNALPLVADFNASVTFGSAPLSVEFTDLSEGDYTYWLWDFGDGNTSTEQNPIHVYKIYGTYSVSLTVSNGLNSSTKTYEDLITAPGPCVASYVNPFGDVKDVFVSGNYAYLADGAVGLMVLDISDPSHPALAKTFNIGGYANEIFLSGNYAYITDEYYLKVVDISDLTNISILDSVVIYGPSSGLFVSGDYVYTITGAGILVIDASDLTNLLHITSVHSTTPGISVNISASGTYAYVAHGSSGVMVIDISNPRSPFTADYIKTYNANDIFASGNYLYVADLEKGIKIFDITDPINAKLVGYLDTESYAWEIYVSENHAYVTDHYEGVTIYDISDPTTPHIIGSLIANYAVDVITSTNYIYVVYGYDDLVIYEKNCGVVTANFTANHSYVELGGPVQFTDLSTNDPISWDWDFGDGGTSIEQNPSHIYTVIGVYTVGLSVSDGNITNTKVINDYITVDVATGVEENQTGSNLPQNFELKQNYPNPFNPSTEIMFSLPTSSDIKLEVFNMLGQRLAVIFEGKLPAGYHTCTWEEASIASGMYLYKLTAGDFVETKKMMLIK